VDLDALDGPSGGSDALYERHLTFDRVVPVAAATPRDRFEAVARSVRDLLSQRWIKTEQTYHTRNAKRVYYLSLEFLMGRSLANNITNLLLDPVWSQLCKKHKIDPLEIVEQEPDAGLGNGGLGRLAACFLDSMATLGIPGMGSGLRYEYGIFKQTVRDGWQHEQPDHWLARPDPWEVARPNEAVEVRLACSFDIQAGALRTVQGRPSTLLGIPYDRPVVGYGGRTINTLRLWSAATPDYFDFQQFSSGDFVGALAQQLGRAAHDHITLVRQLAPPLVEAAFGCFGGRIQFGHAINRPSPNAVRKAQQRAAMRHSGETESTIPVSVDRRRARQMRSIGAAAERHLFSIRRGKGIATSANAKINENGRCNEHRCIGADQYHAEHHGRCEAMDRLPAEEQKGQQGK